MFFADVNIYLVVGFSFKPPGMSTPAAPSSFSFSTPLSSAAPSSFSFSTPLSSAAPSSFSFSNPLSSAANATAVTTAVGSQPPSFTFGRPVQLGGASANASGAFSFPETSGFSFKPPQPTVSENKGE